MERSNISLIRLEREIMAIMTMGIDLAKNGFAAHGVNTTGKSVPRIGINLLFTS